jgi:5-methylcytosine-specific restriction enzyme subunit McrC
VSTPAIPIKNLYYLFCYAWNHFQEAEIVPVEATSSPEIADLLAQVLLGGTRRLLRLGPDRGYLTTDYDLSCVRGRIVLGETIARNLSMKARIHCEFDELTFDVLHNQILKSTLLNLSKTDQLDSDLSEQLTDIARRFADVRPIRLNRLSFRRLQLSRNTAYYDFLMKICELVRDALLPEESAGRFRFRDILRDERMMAKVFQEFVFNFYRLEQKEFRVSSDRIYWDLDKDQGPAFGDMLPSMLTDVSLRTKDRTVIVDTKYYRQTFQEVYGSESVWSSNLYQMFAYLKNLEARSAPDANAEGVLLYPTVSKAADLCGRIQGHSFRIFTLDLSQEWPDIRGDLLGLLGSSPPSTAHAAAPGDGMG